MASISSSIYYYTSGLFSSARTYSFVMSGLVYFISAVFSLAISERTNWLAAFSRAAFRAAALAAFSFSSSLFFAASSAAFFFSSGVKGTVSFVVDPSDAFAPPSDVAAPALPPLWMAPPAAFWFFYAAY